MPVFELLVETTAGEDSACLRLKDAHGRQLAFNSIRLGDPSVAMWEGLLDTGDYVARYAGNQILDGASTPATAAQLLDGLGVFLGQHVLGPEIMAALSGNQRRTLAVSLPGAADNTLAAALARVPWEIARTALDQPTLAESNVALRVVTPRAVSSITDGVGGSSLRVLLVYAEAPGSSPLAMRQEREELLRLFYDKVMPYWRVDVDVLCHGVTASRLRNQIERRGGYHVVHWSGHGDHDLLELLGEDGQPDCLTGGDLVDLIVAAGGFIPRLVFLSACLSGTVLEARDWATFEAGMAALSAGRRPVSRGVGDRQLRNVLAETSGFAGTALALLQAGVPEVVAMRYEVGDDYARCLAGSFYGHLLADEGQHPTESALSLARNDLMRLIYEQPTTGSAFGPVDHATPVLFGEERPALHLPTGRSPQLRKRRPRPQPLLVHSRDLCPPEVFVGRGSELTRLSREWLTDGERGVALVQGLAGLGKTAVAAEVIHLWHARFDFVLAFQAKPLALPCEEFYRQFHDRLALESTVYRERCDESPHACVYLEPGRPLSGSARLQRMRDNLVEALRDEAVLLVLDNLETNLTPVTGGFAMQDPEWESILETLSEELPRTRSRLIVTSRHRPTVLECNNTVWVPLGPLPMGEAGLYVFYHPGLRALYYADDGGRGLVDRLLTISRGHPLILDRLSALSGDRVGLSQALDQLDSRGLDALPDAFVGTQTEAERNAESAYLEDVATSAVDLLIERATMDARRLLWTVSLADEPVSEVLLEGVWSGQNSEDEAAERMRALLADEPSLPTEIRERLASMPAAVREALLKRPPAPLVAQPVIRLLLDELQAAGLLSESEGDDQASFSVHELVRERILQWMDRHPKDRGGHSCADVWAAYGERYAGYFLSLWRYGGTDAVARAPEMGLRALVYCVRGHAYTPLNWFASGLVTSTRDPALLGRTIEPLQVATDQAPSSLERWQAKVCLADALDNLGQIDEALVLYEATVAQAEAEHRWAGMAAALHNWAGALRSIGRIDDAKRAYERAAEGACKADAPPIYVAVSEMAAMSIQATRDRAATDLPHIEQRVKESRGEWDACRTSGIASGGVERAELGRCFMIVLDVARRANLLLGRWQACLDLSDQIEQVQHELGESAFELAVTASNRCGPLLRLDQVGEALRTAEQCLDVFRDRGDAHRQAAALSTLAGIWCRLGDVERSISLERQALALENGLPDPAARAMSHGNLATYLNTLGRSEEATRHHLAALTYHIVTGDAEATTMCLRHLLLRAGSPAGDVYRLPSTVDLLARPDFRALKHFLAEWNVNLGELQQRLGEVVTEAFRGRQAGDGDMSGHVGNP